MINASTRSTKKNMQASDVIFKGEKGVTEDAFGLHLVFLLPCDILDFIS